VLQTPTRPSHEAVRRYVPFDDTQTEERDDVCRTKVARVDEVKVEGCEEGVILRRVKCATGSCDALAMRRDWSVPWLSCEVIAPDGRTQSDVKGLRPSSFGLVL
jgi:hypothetical protein